MNDEPSPATPTSAAPPIERTPRRDWTRVEFEAVADVAHDVAGLVFPPNRRSPAEGGMRRAIERLQLASPAALLDAVREPGHARDVLLAELTIGESYFFREPAALDYLRRHVLAEFRKKTDDARPLRIWSAGCAAGEEPYTIAIVLREMGWPAPVHILGTDISLPRLVAARRGRYSRWALRGVSESVVDRWFTREGASFHIAPEIQRAVEFRPLNLLASDGAALETIPAGSQDIIFCRNVLIYFDERTIADVGRRLIDALAPGGWLILGASDPALPLSATCSAHPTGAGMAYRRSDGAPGSEPERASERFLGIDLVPSLPNEDAVAEAPHSALFPTLAPREAPGPAHESAETAATASEAYRAGRYEDAERIAAAAIARGTDDAALWVVRVRALANLGRLAAADALCIEAIDRHRDSAELAYLHAMLLAEADQHSAAAQAARRSVYLDRTLVMGHVTLGESLSRVGEPARARRAFENALALLDALDPDAIVPSSDGIPASRLARIVRERLGMLPDHTRR